MYFLDHILYYLLRPLGIDCKIVTFNSNYLLNTEISKCF